jgi:hypothetical protein
MPYYLSENREVAMGEEPKEKIRLTLDVTPAMKQVIDGLATESGTTGAEVLRRAVALLNTIKKAERQEQAEAALVKDGEIVYKLVGF